VSAHRPRARRAARSFKELAARAAARARPRAGRRQGPSEGSAARERGCGAEGVAPGRRASAQRVLLPPWSKRPKESRTSCGARGRAMRGAAYRFGRCKHEGARRRRGSASQRDRARPLAAAGRADVGARRGQTAHSSKGASCLARLKRLDAPKRLRSARGGALKGVPLVPGVGNGAGRGGAGRGTGSRRAGAACASEAPGRQGVAHAHARSTAHTHTRTHACMHAHTSTPTHPHPHPPTHTHTHTHTHTLTRARTHTLPLTVRTDIADSHEAASAQKTGPQSSGPPGWAPRPCRAAPERPPMCAPSMAPTGPARPSRPPPAPPTPPKPPAAPPRGGGGAAVRGRARGRARPAAASGASDLGAAAGARGRGRGRGRGLRRSVLARPSRGRCTPRRLGRCPGGRGPDQAARCWSAECGLRPAGPEPGGAAWLSGQRFGWFNDHMIHERVIEAVSPRPPINKSGNAPIDDIKPTLERVLGLWNALRPLASHAVTATRSSAELCS
jgi:hypothetical protein